MEREWTLPCPPPPPPSFSPLIVWMGTHTYLLELLFFAVSSQPPESMNQEVYGMILQCHCGRSEVRMCWEMREIRHTGKSTPSGICTDSISI